MAPPQKQNQDQQDQDTTTLHQPAPHRVADDEQHDSKPAKNASNAALQKEAAKGTAHTASNVSSAKSAKSALEAFAAEIAFYSGAIATTSGDNAASATKQQQERQDILDAVATVNNDAKRAQVLISAIADNKRNELAEAVGKARGHFDRFKIMVIGAQHWLNNHGYKDDHLSLSDAETAVATYSEHITEKIVDDDKHSGDKDATRKDSIETNLAALKDDVTAVEKQSWSDVDRIKKHVAALQQVGEKGHPLMHQHQRDLSDLRERIRELDKKPQIQGDLAISANGLLGLMQ